MKKLFLIIAIVIYCSSAFAQWDDNTTSSKKKKNFSELPIDVKNGFKMVRFGETVDAYRNVLRPLGLGVDTVFFVEDPDLLRIGDIPIKEFTIATKKGIIYALMFKIEGYSQDIKNIFIEAYGNTYETPNRFIENFIWRGKKVALIYNYSSITKMVDCTMTGFDALKTADEIDAKKNKERSKDL